MCSIWFLESKSACWSSLSSSRVEISSSTWEWVITWLVFANIRNWNSGYWGSPLYFWWTRHLNLGSPRKGRLEDSPAGVETMEGMDEDSSVLGRLLDCSRICNLKTCSDMFCRSMWDVMETSRFSGIWCNWYERIGMTWTNQLLLCPRVYTPMSQQINCHKVAQCGGRQHISVSQNEGSPSPTSLSIPKCFTDLDILGWFGVP